MRKRDLHQDDLLFPLLFIIMVEALGRSILEDTHFGRIEGIKLVEDIPPLSYQQFVDDTLIFVGSSIPQDQIINKILELHEGAIGQKINFEKSKLYFLNTRMVLQQGVANIFYCTIGESPNSYLGTSLFKGRI